MRPNQAPRQGGADIGVDESTLVGAVNDPGSHIPSVEQIIKVSISN